MAAKKGLPAKMPKGAENPEFERLERRKRVTDLYLKGWSQHRIAKEVGVSQVTVSNDITAVRDEWLALAIVNLDEKKALEIARIDHLEEVAWQAWERSVGTVEKRKKGEVKELRSVQVEGESSLKKGGRGKPKFEERLEPTKVIDETLSTDQAGDPRFLERVSWCIEMRLKIMGALKEANQTFNFVNLDWDALHGPPADEPDPVQQRIAEVKSLNGRNGHADHAAD